MESCPGCGSRSWRFDETSGHTICAVCGHVRISDEQVQDDIRYREVLYRAKEYLYISEWEKAYKLVAPFLESRPFEQRPVLLALCAKTRCFHDVELADPQNRGSVTSLWNRLVRLGCMNSAMREYRERRRSFLAKELKRSCLFILLLAVACIMLCTVLRTIFSLILSAIIAVAQVWRFCTAKPVLTLRLFRRLNESGDSFS